MTTLSEEDLRRLNEDMNSVGSVAERATRYYTDLQKFGYPYAAFALGVVRNDTVAGRMANSYLAFEAKTKYGVDIDEFRRNEIISTLMRSDFSYRARNEVGIDAFGHKLYGDISGSDIETYHRAVFGQVGLGADVWTAEIPYRLFGEAGWQMMMRDGEIRSSLEMFGLAYSAALGIGELMTAGTATPQDQRDFLDIETWMGTVETLEAGAVGRDVMRSFKGFDAMNLGIFVPSALELPGGVAPDAGMRQAAALFPDLRPAADAAGFGAGPLGFAAGDAAGLRWPDGIGAFGPAGAAALPGPPLALAAGLDALLGGPGPGAPGLGGSGLAAGRLAFASNPEGTARREPPPGPDADPWDRFGLTAVADRVFGPHGSASGSNDAPDPPDKERLSSLLAGTAFAPWAAAAGSFGEAAATEGMGGGRDDRLAAPADHGRTWVKSLLWGPSSAGPSSVRPSSVAAAPAGAGWPGFSDLRPVPSWSEEAAAAAPAWAGPVPARDDRPAPAAGRFRPWPPSGDGRAAIPVASGSAAAPDTEPSAPAILAVDDLMLDRIVRGYIDRACSGGASGAQRPDPGLRLMPAGTILIG